MNKSLEALEKFKLLYESKCKEQPKNLIGFDMCYITIKQDLERLEELEKENLELKELQELNKQGLWNLKEEKFNQSLFLNGEIDKRQKAIEILKDKSFVLEFGLSVFKWYEEEKIYCYYHEYTEYFGEDLEYRATEYILTRQEYELLKEVLENE